MRKINFIIFYLLLSTIVAQDQPFDVGVRPSCVEANKTICVDSLTSTIHLLTTKGWIQQSDDTVVLRTSDDPFYYLQSDLEQIELSTAWQYTTGGVNALGDTISLAVIDASFDVGHEDLQDNIWRNPAEISDDSIDNDLNGYIDDVFGLQLINDTDDHDQGAISNHGTSVLGIISAVGDNQIGVSGICQSCKLMLLSARGDQEITMLSTILKGVQYIIDMKKAYLNSNGEEGAFVVAVNCSWGIDYAFSQDHPVWCALLDSLGTYGIIPVGAVTNNDVNIDQVGDMPSHCPSDYLITVQESNGRGQLKNGTGYGAEYVDIAAPASGYSTRWGNKYGVFGGTSGAAPHITGAIGLMSSLPIPTWNYFQREQPAAAALLIKQILLSNVDKDPTFLDRSVSGGELNLGKAMDALHAYFTPQPENKISRVFPQPANNVLRVQLSSNQSSDMLFTFYDMLGRPTQRSTARVQFAGQPFIELNVEDLSAGLYMMEVQSETQKFAQLIMINK